MSRNEQEMIMWLSEYVRSTMRDAANRAAEVDAAVAEFRRRYPVETTADDATGKAIAALLDDIAGDAAFPGLSDTMQSRIYAAVESLRNGQPTAPAPVWYDEPPFPKDGTSYPCWVDDDAVHGDVHWDGSEWWVWIVGSAFRHALAGRRVSPIAKPQEPSNHGK